jgi:hypothetical protein
MVAVHNTQQSNISRAAEVDYSSAFVEQRVVVSTMRHVKPMFPTDAYNEGAAIHCRKRHHPSPGGKIGRRSSWRSRRHRRLWGGGGARRQWSREAGVVVVVGGLLGRRGALTMRHAFE